MSLFLIRSLWLLSLRVWGARVEMEETTGRLTQARNTGGLEHRVVALEVVNGSWILIIF